MHCDTYYGNFRQLTFADCWSTASEFLAEYTDSGLAPTDNKISNDSATVLFYLLYSRYGNSVISSSDLNQFKYQVFATIYQYGPTWEKRLAVQSTLRALDEDELLTGSVSIANHAYNPSTEPATDSEDLLPFINEQNVNKAKRGVLTGYANLLDLLETDVTGQFLDHFKRLFLQIVLPEKPLWYINESEDNNT